VNNSTTISRQGLGPIFWGIKDLALKLHFNNKKQPENKEREKWNLMDISKPSYNLPLNINEEYESKVGFDGTGGRKRDPKMA
jgi:hypothetical protein